MSGALSLRKLHLYLGCLFAPALIFFTVSGCLQTFDLSQAHRDSPFQPPYFLQVLSAVHMHQRLTPGPGQDSTPFKIFVVIMSAALMVTVLIGVRLAFQTSRNLLAVSSCLAAGVLLPLLLLMLK